MNAMKNLTLALSLLLSACSTIEVAPPADVEHLVSGRELFGDDVAAAPAVDMLALDDEMRAYVEEKTGGTRHSVMKLRRLIAGMIEDGLLNLDYDPDLTHTAMETFHSRKGNCLSFSTLFVALARQAGLQAIYQVVEVPPIFATDGEVVLLNDHVNVLVREIREGTLYTRDHIVDFNTADYRGDYEMTRVSDDYARALFQSNLAIESLRAGKQREAFAHLKSAIALRPDIPGLWVNLGVMYARSGHYELAVEAYNEALAQQSSNRSALADLAIAYDALGQPERAQAYRDEVNYYLARNPYYRLYLAQVAMDARRFDEALAEIDHAIRLKDNEHRFYHLRGVIHYYMNELDKAVADFEEARRLANNQEMVDRYNDKLATLKARN